MQHSHPCVLFPMLLIFQFLPVLFNDELVLWAKHNHDGKLLLEGVENWVQYVRVRGHFKYEMRRIRHSKEFLDRFRGSW